MSRQEIIGFVLIFIVLMGWLYFNAPSPQTAPPKVVAIDTIITPKQAVEKSVDTVKAPKVTPQNIYGKYFEERLKGDQKILAIETDYYYAEITSKGGMIRKWELKNFKTWNGHPVQLINFDKKGDFSLLFNTSDGKVINTRELFFDVAEWHWKKITLTGNQFFTVQYTLPASNGGKIVKSFTFTNEKYGFKSDVELMGLANVIANYKYEVLWENGLQYAERNSFDEATFSAGYIYAGKELTEINAEEYETPAEHTLTGNVDWVASITKYFGVAIIPGKGSSSGAYVVGSRLHLPDNGAYETYALSIEIPYKGNPTEKQSFEVFLGPLDIGYLKSYDVDLEQIMSLGWWIIRPIAEYVLLPLFLLINMGIPNWGLVIIVFSIIIKIALHPLTRSQMKSMKKMQALQPMIEEIKTKYKDDAQKMNMAVMNLYKEYGVNPAGGCLPLLLQMPILFALYNVFSGAIELRQSAFAWWITDLSVPDKIFTLPFHIPFFGFDEVSGLALIMGISMFIQTKMSTTDPRQKAMIWMMPILMTLVFNSLPSGLNLYYLVFNFLSIGQQYYINKKHNDEPLKKVEQKKRPRGGLFSRLPSPSELQKMAGKRKK